MFEIFNKRSQFWQWDTGQKLIVDENVCNEVHFCNGTSECSLVCEVYEEAGIRLVNVPNILLQEAKAIKVYAYVCDDEDHYTERMRLFHVLERTKPDNYVYTETEILDYRRYETIARELNTESKEAAERATKAAETASASERASGESRTAAAESARLAKQSETNAHNSETNAEAHKNGAVKSATEAKLSASLADQSEKNAAFSASSAAVSAERAEQIAVAVTDAIDSLFCTIGEYYKVNLLSSSNVQQGAINLDLTIDGSRTDRVVYTMMLEKNRAYYLCVGSLNIVDMVLRDSDGIDRTWYGWNVPPTAYIAVGETDHKLMFSLKKPNDSELLVSDKSLDECYLYECVRKIGINTDGLLKQGYFSFTQKEYVESNTRVSLSYDVGDDKVYRVIAPNGVVIREMVLYDDSEYYSTICSNQSLKGNIIIPSAYYYSNKLQIILCKPDHNDTITVDDCANLIFEEVY